MGQYLLKYYLCIHEWVKGLKTDLSSHILLRVHDHCLFIVSGMKYLNVSWYNTCIKIFTSAGFQSLHFTVWSLQTCTCICEIITMVVKTWKKHFILNNKYILKRSIEPLMKKQCIQCQNFNDHYTVCNMTANIIILCIKSHNVMIFNHLIIYVHIHYSKWYWSDSVDWSALFFINVSISFPQVSRKVSKCGFLFVAPDFDFSNPLEKTKVNNDVPCACQKSALKINCSWKYKHNAKKMIS